MLEPLSAVAVRQPPLALARHLHDTVAQRLAGLSYLLSEVEASPDDPLFRCREEVDAALDELRDALTTVAAAPQPTSAPDVTTELELLRAARPSATIEVPVDDLSFEPRGLVAAFLVESLRNVRKHAIPTTVRAEVRHGPDVITITIVNDGVTGIRGPSCGAGRRLLQVEASLHGGLVESGSADAGAWRQQLLLPTEALRAPASC